MALSVLFVLSVANVVVSLLRSLMPSRITISSSCPIPPLLILNSFSTRSYTYPRWFIIQFYLLNLLVFYKLYLINIDII